MKWYVFLKIMIKGYEINFSSGSKPILCYVQKPQTTQKEMHMAAMTLQELNFHQKSSTTAGIHLSVVKWYICDH